VHDNIECAREPQTAQHPPENPIDNGLIAAAYEREPARRANQATIGIDNSVPITVRRVEHIAATSWVSACTMRFYARQAGRWGWSFSAYESKERAESNSERL